jgi:hypothetical protein
MYIYLKYISDLSVWSTVRFRYISLEYIEKMSVKSIPETRLQYTIT